MGNSSNKIGKITHKVKSLLSLESLADENIYIGEANIKHIQNKHYNDYVKYIEHLPNILANPDYVGINPKDNSVEYVKEFIVNNEFVKVAVRITAKNKYFVRSMYVLNNNRVNNFINKGKLKKY